MYLLTKAGSTVTEEWSPQSLFAFLPMYFLIIGLGVCIGFRGLIKRCNALFMEIQSFRSEVWRG